MEYGWTEAAMGSDRLEREYGRKLFNLKKPEKGKDTSTEPHSPTLAEKKPSEKCLKGMEQTVNQSAFTTRGLTEEVPFHSQLCKATRLVTPFIAVEPVDTSLLRKGLAEPKAMCICRRMATCARQAGPVPELDDWADLNKKAAEIVHIRQKRH